MDHLTQDQMTRYGENKTDEAEMDEIYLHISECPDCETALHEFLKNLRAGVSGIGKAAEEDQNPN